MNGAEFLFSFFGLLLGLAVANVAGGFGEMWRGRGDRTVGSAVPLLGLLVLLCVCQQWLGFWQARALFDMGPWMMIAAIGIATPYIFIASVMIPRDGDAYSSLDDYYLDHSRSLLTALLIPAIVNVIATLAFSGALSAAAPYYAVRLGVPVVLIFWRRLAIHRIGLGVLIAAMIFRIFS